MEVEESASTIAEKTLTAEDRKAKGMVFADPENKRFPIPDRAHYSLALSQLSHASYKGFDKSKVRSAILAHGKRMGWASDEKAAEELAVAYETIAAFESASLVTHLDEADVAKSRGGKLLLSSIQHHADHIGSTARALSDYGNGYFYGTTPTATDVPEANQMMTGTMHSNASQLKKMTRLLHTAEGAMPMASPPSTAPQGSTAIGDGQYESEEVEDLDDDEIILESDASGSPIAITFTESSGNSEVTKGEVRGTMIAAGFNKSKARYYNAAALKEAVDKKMFVGKPMFLDHATEAENRARPEGSVRNMAAIIQETSVNKDGSIAYRAKLADPVFESKLAYMQKNGILGGIGVSIRAAGSGVRKTIDGTDTFMVEHLVEAYSTDFVTLPGAYGSIDIVESERTTAPPSERQDTTMDEKAMSALLESLAKTVGDAVATAVKPISDSNEKLIARMDGVEAQGRIRTMIEATDLHAATKKRLLLQFAESTKTDGVEAAIEAERAYLLEVGVVAKAKEETAEPKKITESRKLGRNPVEGMGVTLTEGAEKPKATFEDLKSSRVAGWFGGAAGVEKLKENLA